MNNPQSSSQKVHFMCQIKKPQIEQKSKPATIKPMNRFQHAENKRSLSFGQLQMSRIRPRQWSTNRRGINRLGAKNQRYGINQSTMAKKIGKPYSMSLSGFNQFGLGGKPLSAIRGKSFSDKYTGGLSPTSVSPNDQPPEVNSKLMSIFCPSDYKYPTRFQEFPMERYVLAVDGDNAKSNSEFQDLVKSQQDIDSYLLKNPNCKIFSFEQVMSDNLLPNSTGLAKRSASSKSRSRSRQGNKSANSSYGVGEPSSKSAMFKDSVIKEKINEALYSSIIHFQNLNGSKDSSSVEGQVRPDLRNFCYVQLSSYPQTQPVFPLSLNQDTTVHRNFGSFMSLKQIEEGNNMAVKGIQEIINFQKEQLNVLGNGIRYGLSPRPKVKLQVVLFHNSDIYDMLTDQGVQRVRLEKEVNEIYGSKTNGQVFQNIVGATQINVHTLGDIRTVIRAAQQSKASLSEELKLDITELTMRTSVLIRAQIEDQSCSGVQTFDFLEMPASNVMSSPKLLAFSGDKRDQQKTNKKHVIEAYKAVSAALVLLQTVSRGSKIDEKKSKRLESSVVTKAIQGTLFFSYPCLAVVSCQTAPEQTSYPQSLTALTYTSQIREHVLRKVRKGQLNQDLAGQTIETIAQELSIMQQKLDKEYASLASIVNQDPEVDDTANQNEGVENESNQTSDGAKKKDQSEVEKKQRRDMALYSKLSELVQIYQTRVKELQSQHQYSQRSHREIPKKLEEEIKSLREELTHIQSELGLEPDMFNFQVNDQKAKTEIDEDYDDEDQILQQLNGSKSKYGDEPDLMLQNENDEEMLQLPRELSSKNQVQFQLDDCQINSQPATTKNNLQTDYSLVLESGNQNKGSFIHKQAPHYFQMRSGKTLQSNNSRSHSPEPSGESFNGLARKKLRKHKGTISMLNSGSFSSSKIPAYIRGQNSTLNLDKERQSRSLTKSQKSLNSRKSRGSKKSKSRLSAQSKSRLSAHTISSKKKTKKFRDQENRSKVKSHSDNRSKNSSISRKRPLSKSSKQKRSNSRSIASRSNKQDQSLNRGIMNNSNQIPFRKNHQNSFQDYEMQNQNSSKRVDFSLELSGTESNPMGLGSTFNDGNLAQFGQNNQMPKHVVQSYVNPYTDHAGSSLNLKHLPHNAGQANFDPQQDQVRASRSHQLGSVDLSIMSSQGNEINAPTPSSLANKSKQLLQRYREAKKASKTWGSQESKIPHIQEHNNDFQESFLQSQQLQSHQNQSMIDQATAEISENYENHIHGLLSQMVSKDQEIQELNHLLQQAENRTGQIEMEMNQEIQKIRQLITPRSEDIGTQHQVKSVNEKMVELLQFKIQSKKQISELTFKAERLQRINRKITDENEQMTSRLQWQEKTIQEQSNQIDDLTRQLDVSVYENPKPKLKSMKKSFKRRASSKSNSKTRNFTQIVHKRSSSRMSQNSKKSQNSRCFSASKKSILSLSSKKRDNSHTSAKKRSVSIGVRSGTSVKTNKEKTQLRENITRLENELEQVKLMYSNDNENLKKQAMRIKANLDMTLLQKKGLEGEVNLIRSSHQELQSTKQLLEQESQVDKSKLAELEQAYNHLQEVYNDQSLIMQETSQRYQGIDDKMKALEEAKNLYRAQYLELREANKDLKMKCKATQKTINAQKDIYYSQTRYRGLSVDKENEEIEGIGETGKKIQSRILQDMIKERDAGRFSEIRNQEV